MLIICFNKTTQYLVLLCNIHNAYKMQFLIQIVCILCNILRNLMIVIAIRNPYKWISTTLWNQLQLIQINLEHSDHNNYTAI